MLPNYISNVKFKIEAIFLSNMFLNILADDIDLDFILTGSAGSVIKMLFSRVHITDSDD
jgi:hypothetical protein